MAYRQEHPKPQFERKNWMNLNGKWEFQNDPAASGTDRGLQKFGAVFDSEIEVPFCPQSKLSGIGETDYYRSVWYRRKVSLTAEQLSGRVVLHFGAVDYDAAVFINEEFCGGHSGGYASFSFDVTDFVHEGENTLVVRVYDDERSGKIPRGKQCPEFYPHGCVYTRTTGIWQTVWLEFTPKTYIESFRLTPNVDSCSLNVKIQLVGTADLGLSASFGSKDMGAVALKNAFGFVEFDLPLKEKHLWELGRGGLYDLEFTFGKDKVYSYFGLRSINYSDRKFYLNGKSVFQRLVLDQGFYPDGIYTAPSDQELEADVDRSMAMGFNGARLHQKVFEERFLYHCDRKGYIVWGEFPGWGADMTDWTRVLGFVDEWLDCVKRDMNHPSIVGWCPYNECWGAGGRVNKLLEFLYKSTKAVDPSRPCIEASGGEHIVANGKTITTDIYDVHNYDQNPVTFRQSYAAIDKGEVGEAWHKCGQKYDGTKPFFVSEYGGLGWMLDDNVAGWGYGDDPTTEEEFLTRLKGLNDAMLDNEHIFALCYTQLTDVEQEQNGLYTYDRKPKFDPEVVRPLFARKAAIED